MLRHWYADFTFYNEKFCNSNAQNNRLYFQQQLTTMQPYTFGALALYACSLWVYACRIPYVAAIILHKSLFIKQ